MSRFQVTVVVEADDTFEALAVFDALDDERLVSLGFVRRLDPEPRPHMPYEVP